MSEGASGEAPSRFVVGIDLGTTNTALAYVDGGELAAGETPRIHSFAIPQLTAPGTVEARPLLPSFLYLPAEGSIAREALRLPWGDSPDGVVVGELAARRAAEVPDQVVSSAKSWLCHAGVDRSAPILPWVPAAEGRSEGPAPRCCSPLAAQTAILAHLRDAWNHAFPGKGERLEEQEILLTVPASFDAGLTRVHLLEEPQAAVYAWVHAAGDAWREQVELGDVLLVCDVGGGTTDLSLVVVDEEEGGLALRRVAVGDHLLLGGDNMDLTLAMHVRERLARAGNRIDAWQFRGLVLACREAKETLLGDDPPATAPLVVLGRGKKLIGGTLRTELSANEVKTLLEDGFFPEVDADARVTEGRQAGLSELGLAYASDPAITRHLATFVATHAASSDAGAALPNVILFNGGVMRAPALRARVARVVGGWRAAAGASGLRLLEGGDLERAVALGAAYYGLARRGRGIRIRGGAARSYYVGVASAMPAVPGFPPPVKSVCVVPFGVEEGTTLEVPGAEFGLLVGATATFRFFASSTRRDDRVGQVLDEWETGELEELAPLSVAMDGDAGGRVPVRLSAHVTAIGTLELWFGAPGGRGRWRLEFNVREGGAAA